jgi:cobalt-zinc-cadmium efflux system protein
MIKIKEEFRLPVVLCISLLLVSALAAGSFFSKSLSVLSYAGLILAVSLSALPLILNKSLNISKEADEGLRRSQFYSMCINGFMLLTIAIYIIYKSAVLFANPRGISLALTGWMVFSALTGLIFCMLILYPQIRKNKDIKTLFIKYAMCAVLMPLITAASVIYYVKDMYFLDPAVSVFIALFIIIQTALIMKQAFFNLIQK